MPDAEEHLGLVYREASRMAWQCRLRENYYYDGPPSFIGVGYLGLLSACESFDASRGWTFSTYATYRIRGAMLDMIRQDSGGKGKRGWLDLRDFENSDDVNLSRPLTKNIPFLDRMSSQAPSVIDTMLTAEQANGLQRAIKAVLTEREQDVLISYYWKQEHQKAIGHRLNVTESRINQILRRTRKKLSQHLTS